MRGVRLGRLTWLVFFDRAIKRRMKHRVRAISVGLADYDNMLAVGVRRGGWRQGARMTLGRARMSEPERVAAAFDRRFIAWIKRPKRGRRAGWKKRRRLA